MSRRFLLSLLVGLALSVSAFTQTAPTPQSKVNIIIDRENIRFAPQGLAVEMRLVVTDQSGAEIYDSGPMPVSTLDWLMRDSKGEAVKGGLYLYRLSLKDAAGAVSERRGHLIVNRAGESDHVYIATGDKVGIGADNEASQVTVISGPDATVGRAELPSPERGNYVASGRDLGGLSMRSEMRRNVQDRQLEQRVEDGSRAAPNGPQAAMATAGRLTKFADGAGNLTDSGVVETFVNNGLVQTFGSPAATIAAANHVVEIVSANGKTPLTLVGGAGAMEFWRDTLPTSAVSFGVAKPATPAVATDDMVFSSYADANKVWFERMRLTNGGNLGIGTPAPATRLHVAGGDILFENKWRTETTVVNPGPKPGPPNLIGGFLGTGSGGATPGNRVTPGVVGATISGGGFNGGLIFPSGQEYGADNTNRVTDWFGTIGGGTANRAGNDDATLDNAVGATVAGGTINTASGSLSTVGGGHLNTVSGFLSTVPGGFWNIAQGDYSFAAGQNAKANHQGAFVWADATFNNFSSTGNHQFLIRAAGGVGIGLNNPTEALPVSGNIRANGNVCAANIACASDARLKEQVVNLTYGLPHLLRLRPVRWQWKDPATKQLTFGLIAQEVEGVLPELVLRDADPTKPLGLNYLGLMPVVIKAIQEQQSQLAAKDVRIQALEARLAALEQSLQQLLGQQGQTQTTKHQQ